MRQITVNEWNKNTRNYLKRHSNLQPTTPDMLRRMVAEAYYPDVAIEDVMASIVTWIVKRNVDKTFIYPGNDPNNWTRCVV